MKCQILFSRKNKKTISNLSFSLGVNKRKKILQKFKGDWYIFRGDNDFRIGYVSLRQRGLLHMYRNCAQREHMIHSV